MRRGLSAWLLKIEVTMRRSIQVSLVLILNVSAAATLLIIPILLTNCSVHAATTAPAIDDAYEKYVNTSKDFQKVKQDKEWCYAAYPSWTYMPWTYQWTVGYTEESGKWSSEHGYNGAFLDHGDISSNLSKTGKLDWIDRFKFRFYVDHVASDRKSVV